MEYWDIPPYPGDEHFDLGVWHLSALPTNKQNRDGYLTLKRNVHESLCDVELNHSEEASANINAFHEECVKLVDAIPEEEICSRPWSWLCYSSPGYNLISMVPEVARDMAPKILELASHYGLVFYDPQSDRLSLPSSINPIP